MIWFDRWVVFQKSIHSHLIIIIQGLVNRINPHSTLSRNSWIVINYKISKIWIIRLGSINWLSNKTVHVSQRNKWNRSTKIQTWGELGHPGEVSYLDLADEVCERVVIKITWFVNPCKCGIITRIFNCEYEFSLVLIRICCSLHCDGVASTMFLVFNH